MTKVVYDSAKGGRDIKDLFGGKGGNLPSCHDLEEGARPRGHPTAGPSRSPVRPRTWPARSPSMRSASTPSCSSHWLAASRWNPAARPSGRSAAGTRSSG